MMVSTSLPAEAVLASQGAILVSRVNPADPTAGAVPYRNTGLPLALRTQYEAHQDGGFHRYALVDLVGSFDTVEQAAGAVPAAEHDLRIHPAPGVELPREVPESGADAFVILSSGVPLGYVRTQWDPVSRSVVNTTTPLHLMRDGFVVRQVAAAGRNVFVTTFGEGENLMRAFAWLNGEFGPGGFKDTDKRVSRALRRSAGFRRQPLAGPPGSETAYWTDMDDTMEEVRQNPWTYYPAPI